VSSPTKAEDRPKQPTILSYRRHRDANNQAPKYLVKNLLPETGVGLLSGQSGTYKSFVAIKLAGAIATGQSFAGHAIKRQGAVLIFASEGAGELPIRLEALSEAEHGGRVLPIFYCGAGVRLLDRTSVARVIATAKAVAEDAQRGYRLPLVLIQFDTVIAAAQFAKSGDENDAAVGQKLMTALGEISRATSTFVLGIDHFGKAPETGTRGTSAKEAAADVVLTLLADKALSGEVTAPRLCIRKRRSGPAGVEHPFTVKPIRLGQDEDGDEVTSLAIDFSAAVSATAQNPHDTAGYSG
jgi:RecA-family ATPase